MTVGTAALVAEYEALIAAGLALVLQGESPAPVLGDYTENIVALHPVLSCYAAAAAAVHAAAGSTDPEHPRVRAAVLTLTRGSAAMHAHAEKVATRRAE